MNGSERRPSFLRRVLTETIHNVILAFAVMSILAALILLWGLFE